MQLNIKQSVRQGNNEDILNSAVIYMNYEEGYSTEHVSHISYDPVDKHPYYRGNCCPYRTRQKMRFLCVVPRSRYLITLHGSLGKLYHS
jgi:hypothetical protein